MVSVITAPSRLKPMPSGAPYHQQTQTFYMRQTAESMNSMSTMINYKYLIINYL